MDSEDCTMTSELNREGIGYCVIDERHAESRLWGRSCDSRQPIFLRWDICRSMDGQAADVSLCGGRWLLWKCKNWTLRQVIERVICHMTCPLYSAVPHVLERETVHMLGLITIVWKRMRAISREKNLTGKRFSSFKMKTWKSLSCNILHNNNSKWSFKFQFCEKT